MTLAPGTTLGHYEIEALLGSGGMGHVYRARDTRLGRDVAIKIVGEPTRRDASAVDRFVREAHAASRLSHPNIVTIHEIGEAEVGRFIVMELVEGRTLREMLSDGVPWETVAEVGRQIAKALGAAHAAGIVHRDIKPENVLVRDDGYVKVLDFGVARLLPTEAASSEEVTPGATEAGTVLGTLRYMAPEQARAESVDAAADVFALGLVLHELLSGRHPFDAPTGVGVVSRIVSEPALAPSRVRPGIPSHFDSLILRMLEKDPAARPTAGDVEDLLAQEPVASPSTTRRRSVGRNHEREAFRAAFDAAASGNGLLFCVAGEPGIGKTTLVEECLSELEARATIARGHCSERLAGTEAYLPWLEALEDLSGTATADLMRRVAPSWYGQVKPAEADTASKATSQERFKRELASFLLEASRMRPLVLLFEDVHWSDAATVDLLSYLGTRLAAMRLLVVATYRPSEIALGRHPFESVKLDLQSRGVSRELSLGFLSREEVTQYVAEELPGRAFPPEVASFLYERTEGSPLFLSGLLHDLRAEEDLGAAISRSERAVPETVRAMIQRKIEKLGEADRPLLLAASVQGAEFDSAVVARALRKDAAEVEERLAELERVHAFVRREAERELPDRTLSVRYRFVHVLYQNALYGSIAPSRRASLSGAVAEALETHFGERCFEIASELALLFETAREPGRAIDHFLEAARRSARLFAHKEAIGISRRALDSIPRLPEGPERDRRELNVLMALGPQLSLVRGFGSQAAEEIFTRTRELSLRTEDDTQLFRSLYGLCVIHAVRGQWEPAHELSRRLDALAERTEDRHLRLQAHHAIWTALVGEGDLLEARRRLQEGLSLYEPEKHGAEAYSFAGHDPGVCGLAFDGLALWALGHPDQALAKSRDAVALARELSHPFSTGQSELYTAMVHQLRREPAAAREHARETIELTRDQDFPQFLSYGNVLHGWAVAVLGDAQAGRTEIREGVESARTRRDHFLLPHWFVLLAEASLGAGNLDEALAAISDGLEEIQRRGPCYSESELHRVRGEIHRLRGEADEAEGSFREAIDVARRQSARSFELRAVLSLARYRKEKARAMLEEVYSWFTEGQDTPDLAEAKALLA